MRTSAVWLVGLAFLMVVLVTACSEKLPTQEVSGQVEVTDDPIVAQEQMAGRYEYWIDQMDPFVHQLDDGTYVLDREGFLSTLSVNRPETLRRVALTDTSSTDAKIILGLINSVEAGNEQLANKSALGSACWTYWWGRRCCYWGNTAWTIVGVMTAGGWIRYFGWLLTPYGAWAGYLTQVHGGFCANMTWAWPAVVWLTAP